MDSIQKASTDDYRALYSAQYSGWCVFMLVSMLESRFISGAYTSQEEAAKEANRLNEIHKETV